MMFVRFLGCMARLESRLTKLWSEIVFEEIKRELILILYDIFFF